MSIKYLSLFSGIGGFEYGLEQSDYEFECIGASEINKYARSIYFRHFPRHRDLGDASEIDPKGLQDFELLVGGFPCQAFSISGKRCGFDDTRGTLFFEIARICAEKQPRYLLLENVKGLLSHDKGRTFKKILGVLSELGYDVEWSVYNSKSFGTAQNRERLFIKGYFRDKCGSEILSVRRSDQQTLTSSNKLKPVKFNRQVKKRVHDTDYGELSLFLKDAKRAAKVTINEISEKLGKPKSEVEHWFRTDKFFAPPTDDIWFDLKEMLNIETDTYDAFLTEFEWVDGVYEMDKRAYDESGLAPTVTTTDTLAKVNVVDNLSNTGHWGDDVFGLDGVSRSLTATNYKHPLKVKDNDFRIRRLTPRECERLQAFPDDWTRYGVDGKEISDTQRYTCLGNAVTTTVVTWIINNNFFGENIE